MKKSLLASAVAAAVLAGPALAMKLEGPDYEIQVNVDAGFYFQNSTASSGADTADVKGDGINQIEIKGKRKAGDMTVFGEIEVDYDPVGDNDSVLTDDAKIGIKGDFGTIQAGQFDFYFEDKLAEALQREHAADAKLSEAGDANDKDDNHLMWKNKFGGTELAVDLRYDESNSNPGQVAFTVKSKVSDAMSVVAGATTYNDETDAMGIAATLKMSDSTSMTGLYFQEETSAGAETTYTGIALDNKVGSTDMNIAIQEVDADGSAVRTEVSFGIGYELVDGVGLFADHATLDTYNDEGNTTEIGMKYSF